LRPGWLASGLGVGARTGLHAELTAYSIVFWGHDALPAQEMVAWQQEKARLMAEMSLAGQKGAYGKLGALSSGLNRAFDDHIELSLRAGAGTHVRTEEALALTDGLTAEDTVLFLLSGGGSALFESPLIPAEELAQLTSALLACGADIVEMNTIRKRLSAVKGGRFAQLCAPAQVYSIVLSDILGDPLDMIASGPAYPDRSTCAQARAIAEKYQLPLSDQARALLDQETPKELDNVETVITGSVRELCSAAAAVCQRLGYETHILTDQLCCQAREAGSFLASIARTHGQEGRSLAFLAGGETVVLLTGKGLGGRNQELALSAAEGISGMENALIFSLGSDGTDGPTDAAGGIVDGQTQGRLAQAGLTIHQVLADNDAYHALEKVDGLIRTGPTGTNVNDVAVVLLKG